MINLNLTPKFKYSTLLCCQAREVFSKYILTRARSVRKNDYPVQGWNPTSILFRKLNTMVHDRIQPYTTFQTSTLLCFHNRDIFIIYRSTRSVTVKKKINMFRVGTSQPFFQKSQKTNFNIILIFNFFLMD